MSRPIRPPFLEPGYRFPLLEPGYRFPLVGKALAFRPTISTHVPGLPDDAYRTLAALWEAPNDVVRISLGMLGSGSRAALLAYGLITDAELPDLTERGRNVVAGLALGESAASEETRRLEEEADEMLVPDPHRRAHLIARVEFESQPVWRRLFRRPRMVEGESEAASRRRALV